MQNKPKFAVITSFLGKTKDRFCEYQKDIQLADKFEILSEIEDISGIEIVYPYETPEVDELNKLLKKYNLKVSAINCNLKAEKEFLSGAFCSTDKNTRNKAIMLVKNAKDYAADIGADKVHCAPLNDGFDYLFQENYPLAWGYMVEACMEVCEYRPDIKFFIEYKASEPRVNCFIDSAAKALLLCKNIGTSNIGITLDFGHALQRGENPANELCLIAENGIPFYIHINDNNSKWDWDLITASYNFLNYAEFIFWLQEYDYEDFLSFDTSPARLDVKDTFNSNVRITSKIWSLVERLDKKKMKSYMSQGNYSKILKIIEEDIYGL